MRAPTNSAEPRRVVTDRCRDGRCASCRGCEHSCHDQTAPADFRTRVHTEIARHAGDQPDNALWSDA